MRGVSIYQPAPAQHRYWFNQAITWGDASVEQVGLDTDGFFYLNGLKKRLLGFCDPLDFATDRYFSSGNLAIISSELGILATAGTRLISPTIWHSGNGDEAYYDDLMDVYYANKMLLLPEFTAKNEGNFDNLGTINFNMGTGDPETVSTALGKWLDHIIAYPNVLAIVLENEMDLPVGADTYSVADCVSYIDMLYTVVKGKTDLPVLMKFTIPRTTQTAKDFQDALVSYSALPCFGLYHLSAVGFRSLIKPYETWKPGKFTASQSILLEMNYYDSGIDATKLTVAMIDAAFETASAVCLFAQNVHQIPGAAFFDDAGDPIANTTTLLANMDTWQASL